MKKFFMVWAGICLVAAVATGCAESSTSEETAAGTTSIATTSAPTTETTDATSPAPAAGAAKITIANMGFGEPITVSPVGCAAPSNPSLSVACLQLQGSDGPGLCAHANGPVTAYVFAPYRPGTTYISSGKGCASTGNPPRSFCAVVGPATATL